MVGAGGSLEEKQAKMAASPSDEHCRLYHGGHDDLISALAELYCTHCMSEGHGFEDDDSNDSEYQDYGTPDSDDSFVVPDSKSRPKVSSTDSRKPGVISYPVSLQLQCMMFILSHSFTPGNENYISIKSLSLLPVSKRKELLLLLPAVDVCKLEDTPVTYDISMNEIWEEIYKDRMPFKVDRLQTHKYVPNGIGTPQNLWELRRIDSVSWKEAYFNAIFFIVSKYDMSFEAIKFYSNCTHDHIIRGLFYGIGRAEESTLSNAGFVHDLTLCIHDVYSCCLECPMMTTRTHYDKFIDPILPAPRVPKSEYLSVADVIDIMVDCQVSLKHLEISHEDMLVLGPLFRSDSFVQKFSHVLQSLEAITVRRSLTIDKSSTRDYVTTFLDIIFHQNKCSIKSVELEDYFGIVSPYLTFPICKLKQFDFCANVYSKTVMRRNTKKGDAVSIVFNKPYCQMVKKILEHQNEIEVLNFSLVSLHHLKSNYCMENNSIINCLCDIILHQSSLKKISFDCSLYDDFISFDILRNLLHAFFSTTHPISLSLSVSCPQLAPQVIPPIKNNRASSTKSLVIDDCTLSSNFLSLLPKRLVLRELTINCSDLNTLCSFASLRSITVRSFSLTTSVVVTSSTIDLFLSLFRITVADEWKVGLSLEDDVDHDGSKVLRRIMSVFKDLGSKLKVFRLINRSYQREKLYRLLRFLFRLPSRSEPCYFEVGLSHDLLSRKVVEDIRLIWNDCGSFKLKTLRIFDSNFEMHCCLLSKWLEFVAEKVIMEPK